MSLVDNFQDLVATVPDLVQPLVVALAGGVPFIEGEGGAAIGIIGGMNPVVAAIAAAIGNFLSVAVIVLLSSGARQAVVSRTRARAAVAVGGGSGSGGSVAADYSVPAGDGSGGSKRHEKFWRAFERYGVPGVSLLGPLLLPTQFTASMLAGAGVRKSVVLIWQAVAIVLWTTVIAVLIIGVVGVVG